MTETNFDNSILTNVAKCDAWAVAANVLGLRGKEEKIAADMGSVFHSAVEQHFKGNNREKVMEVFNMEYDKIIPVGQVLEEARFAKPNLTKIMERFIAVKPMSVFPFDVIETERVKGMPLDPAGEFIFWVKRDALVRDQANGAVLPLDHKTTKKITDWWAKKFRLASQLTGYMWFTSEEQGVPVQECFVNGVELGLLPTSTKKCKAHGVPYSECSAEHAVFQLLRYGRSEEQIDRWKKDALILARRFAVLKSVFEGHLELLPQVSRNGSFNESCVFCEFKEWCRRGFRQADAEQFVVYDPWEPWVGGERVR